jgi:hypothetical protein
MDIPSTDVIQHWCAWGVTDNCPDDHSEHSNERVEQFSAWLKQIQSDAWSRGYRSGRTFGTSHHEDLINPFKEQQ